MFDHVQLGWLAGDDYRAAAEAAGVVELPDNSEPNDPTDDPPTDTPADPSWDGRCGTGRRVLDDLLTGGWTDDDPGSVGR
ncbi:MAG TPA: hypothetical protein VIR27_21460 [Mycobacteriales bacterium]|jgi:hypothetical protein